MKVFAVISVFLLAFAAVSAELTEEQQKKIIENRENCVKETGVDPEMIDRADVGDFTDDPKLQCFAKCFYQKAGFVNDKGEIVMETLKAKLPEENKEEALAIIEKCKDKKGKDACETAYAIHKCYFKNTHRIVVVPEATEKTADKSTAKPTEKSA
ncbi:unnamed protein product [Brassicogethes aeneus]|uniref:Uncharacterized protein n=1 Tax=Brassicogethes aeneus TaxID=1431903 RepID=A0A9P0AX88_BRAAE|nr:unnamed protein product [Brassicogethes aeneus]